MTQLSEMDINNIKDTLKLECNEYVNGSCRTTACLLRGGYERGRNSSGVEPRCHAKDTMRHIERLEDDRRHLLASVVQLLTFAKPDHDYQRSIIMKAQHLLTMMNEAQPHEREEAR